MPTTALAIWNAAEMTPNLIGAASVTAAVARVEAEILPVALASVAIPIRTTLKGRAASISAAVALAYPNNPDAQAATLSELVPMFESVERKYGVSSLKLLARTDLTLRQASEYRIQANQDLEKALEFLEGVVGLIPPVLSTDLVAATLRRSTSVEVSVLW
jgi:hypothetical protein